MSNTYDEIQWKVFNRRKFQTVLLIQKKNANNISQCLTNVLVTLQPHFYFLLVFRYSWIFHKHSNKKESEAILAFNSYYIILVNIK